MGSTESPEDGAAVAASIFVAVAVYAVSYNVLDSPVLGPLGKEKSLR